MTEPEVNASTLFLEYSRKKLVEQYWPRMRGAVEWLTEEQIWGRPNEASNSIGNLMLHLDGNVRQWLVNSFNREEDHRDRPAEFAQRQWIPASELVAKLGRTMQEAAEVLALLTEADLTARYEIQGYNVTGLYAVYQTVEHFSMHYGQILYIIKSLNGVDLGFYSELNKTGRAN